MDASSQSDDLRPILVNKALRMGQAVAETLDLLAGTTRSTGGWNVESRQHSRIGNEDLNLIGQLKTID